MLIAAEDSDFAALIAGEPVRGLLQPPDGVESAEVLSMLRRLAADLAADFQPSAWLMAEAGEVVGLCSIVVPPADGVVTIGYGVAPQRRGRGIAQRAIAGLVTWAQGDDRVSALAAATSPANVASQRVLAANGFSRIGMADDPDDGPLILWRLATG